MTMSPSERLKHEMEGLVAFADGFAEHYRPTILNNLCRALMMDSRNGKDPAVKRSTESAQETTKGNAESEASESWEYRKAMIALGKDSNINLKKLNQQQFVTLLAYVLTVRRPKNGQVVEFTPEVLVEACRAAGQKQPANAGATLRAAKSRGLIDRKTGQKGYTVAPQGENFVNDLLSGKDET